MLTQQTIKDAQEKLAKISTQLQQLDKRRNLLFSLAKSSFIKNITPPIDSAKLAENFNKGIAYLSESATLNQPLAKNLFSLISGKAVMYDITASTMNIKIGNLAAPFPLYDAKKVTHNPPSEIDAKTTDELALINHYAIKAQEGCYKAYFQLSRHYFKKAEMMEQEEDSIKAVLQLPTLSKTLVEQLDLQNTALIKDYDSSSTWYNLATEVFREGTQTQSKTLSEDIF